MSSMWKMQALYLLCLPDGVSRQTEIWNRLSANVQDRKRTLISWFCVNHDCSVRRMQPDPVRLVCVHSRFHAHRLGNFAGKFLS